MQENQNFGTTEAEVVEAEEVKQGKQNPETINLDSIELIVKRELQKFDTNKEKIAELKKQFSGLKINGENDKEGYEQVRKAVGVLRPLRTGVEKTRKAAKEKYLETGKGIDSYAKELTALLEDIENPLKAMLDEVDNAKELRRQEEERRLLAKLEERRQQLIAAGAIYNGSTYSISFEENVANTSDAELSVLEDNQFEFLLKGFTDISSMIAEAKRIADEEAEANRKLAEQQQKEIEEMKAERRKLRSMRMEALGFVFSISRNVWVIDNEAASNEIIGSDFGEMNTEQWTEYESKAIHVSEMIAEHLNQFQKEQKAEAEAKEKFDARVKSLIGLGLVNDGEQLCYKDINFHNVDITCMTDDEFKAQFEAATERMNVIKAEEEKQLKEKQEREELLAKLEVLKKERIAFLVGKGFVHNEQVSLVEFKGLYVPESCGLDTDVLAGYSEVEFNEAVAQLDEAVANIKKADQAEIDRLAAEKEAKRKALLNDAQKVIEWIEAVQKIEVPTVSEPNMQQSIQIMVEGFDGLKASLLKLQ